MFAGWDFTGGVLFDTFFNRFGSYLMTRALGKGSPVQELTLGTEKTVPRSKAVRDQLDRVLASGDFDASPRSRDFVRYIVEETLAGRADDLTQASIATRVFGRRQDFDATVDPIVRIQAGRLRRSLERYYLLAGQKDAVRIDLPRGTYVPVLRWARPGEAVPRETSGERRTPAADGRPTVVVSPFEHGGSDPGLADAAALLKDCVCVEMGHYGDVHVVRLRELEQLGKTLREGGDYAVSGHLSAGQEGARVSVWLTDCRDANQVWADEYRDERGQGDVFLQEVARAVAARIASEQGLVAQRLWAEQRQRPVEELTPYGGVLASYQFFFDRAANDFLPALAALQRIVRERPEFALAWVQLARLYIANYTFEIVAAPTPIEDAIGFAQKAVQLDPSSQRAHVALAAAFLQKGELAASRAEAERAYEINPDSLIYLEWIGWVIAMSGEWERGTAMIRRAMARNPHHIPPTAHAIWADHIRRGEFEDSYQVALRYRDAVFFWRSLMRACSLGHLDRRGEAKQEVAEILRQKPDFAKRGRTLIGRYAKSPDVFERVVDGLAKAGLKLA
jgi:adenylate cyclase